MKTYTLEEIYSSDMLDFQKARYLKTAKEFEALYGEKPTAFFSAPGWAVHRRHGRRRRHRAHRRRR